MANWITDAQQKRVAEIFCEIAAKEKIMREAQLTAQTTLQTLNLNIRTLKEELEKIQTVQHMLTNKEKLEALIEVEKEIYKQQIHIECIMAKDNIQAYIEKQKIEAAKP